MENAKRKRGRPPKQKFSELSGMTYEGAINNALDKEVKSELDAGHASVLLTAPAEHYRVCKECNYSKPAKGFQNFLYHFSYSFRVNILNINKALFVLCLTVLIGKCCLNHDCTLHTLALHLTSHLIGLIDIAVEIV